MFKKRLFLQISFNDAGVITDYHFISFSLQIDYKLTDGLDLNRQMAKI